MALHHQRHLLIYRSETPFVALAQVRAAARRSTAMNVSTIFPERVDMRTRVMFRELLAMTVKYASLHPDRDAVELIARAKAIAARFDSRGVK